MEEEYESQSVDSHENETEPLMFIDIALSEQQKPVRISLFEDSDPEKVARRFVKQQGIPPEDYLEELLFMLTQAKQNALSQKLTNNNH